MRVPVVPNVRQTSLAAANLDERPVENIPRRLMLWEIEGTLQCSIIGTCLGDLDLLAAIRKHGTKIDARAQSYDVHTYCVHAAHQDCALARALNKLLERKFAGAIRLMGRAKTPHEMQLVWERLRDSGRIGAGYWAVLSHTHIPASFKTRVFGEVHMLSHLNGHGANQLAMRLALAEGKCSDLEARLRRSERAKSEAIAERDAARATSSLQSSKPVRSVITPAELATHDRSVMRLREKLAKCERALIVARARARQAEAAVARPAPQPSAARKVASGPVAARPANHERRERHSIEDLRRCRILYIGGRTSVVPHLRTAAASRVAEFFHHDGGIDDNPHRIEELIEGCDAVICPIDCVSHGACRMAKTICHRLNRRFLPIPTASRSGFERALDQLASEGLPLPAIAASADRSGIQ